MTRITVEHVTRRFWLDDEQTQAIKAVDDVSFKISEGGKVAIIGPSGCGKTTLLRLIAGLDIPDVGQVLYDDAPIDNMPRDERNIGMIFQNFALMPHWESQQTIGFFLRLRNREHEVTERVQRVADITGVGIDKLMARYPNQLSGGEKQRIAIARAFARDLRLLLLDEPFANLDAKLRSQARLEINKLLNEFPVTTVLSTHDQYEAAALSDLILLMREGRVEQVGSYRALYDAPANAFVAGFIGVPTMNLLPGVAQDGRWRGAVFDGTPLPAAVVDGTPITLGIRPEHLFLSRDATADNTQSVRVTDATPYYAERYTLLDVIHAGANVALQVQTALAGAPAAGEQVALITQLRESDVHFFWEESGNRLV